MSLPSLSREISNHIYSKAFLVETNSMEVHAISSTTFTTSYLLITLMVNRTPVYFLLDSSLELDIISHKVAKACGLPIVLHLGYVLYTTSGELVNLVGICEKVELCMGLV